MRGNVLFSRMACVFSRTLYMFPFVNPDDMGGPTVPLLDGMDDDTVLIDGERFQKQAPCPTYLSESKPSYKKRGT